MEKKVYKYDSRGILVETFNSIKEASNSTKIPRTTLWDHLNKEDGYLGFRWMTSPISLAKSKEIEELNTTPTRNLPKILLLDVETIPLRSFTWGTWKQNINPVQLISDWMILCWAAKWLGSEDTISDSVTAEEVKAEDDKRIILNLAEVLEEADIVVYHNGKKFDGPKINTRLLYHGFNPPSPYREIDTLEVARKQFAFTSNKLDAINKFLGLSRKIDTNFELWKDCMDGKKSALLQMEVYCAQDVDCLEEAYLKLRPWMKGVANLDTYIDEATPSCTHCDSSKLAPVLDKHFYTQSNKYQVYRCQDCGGTSRANKSSKFEFKRQVSAIPK